ncbi:MAG: fimbrillin family protein [Muribaculaceae bacterium]|nr:fimbrillin family protein [Muribaculaceae bacterium]
MKYNILPITSVILLTVGLSSCSDSPVEPDTNIPDGKIAMEFSFSHPEQSRATETSFENGDVVGLYVSEADKVLEISGNTVNNESLSYSGSSWSPSRPLYWNAGAYNVYAYYPRLDDVTSITDLPFEVKTDQRAVPSGMDGYEASDFLFASAKGVQASANRVNLQFRHIMSKMSIRLIKGEDFEGEMPETATVYIHNTVTEASVDLMAGVATKATRGTRNTITARQEGPTTYSAVIVPQRIENRMPLIEVVMNGVSFLYESKFLFKPGIHHIVNLVVDKNPEQVKIDIGGEINNWN